MWATISGIFVKYWIEFLLGLVVAGGSFFIKRYTKLEREVGSFQVTFKFNNIDFELMDK